MATQLQLYPYQEESLECTKRQNTIIHLETGRGKTLIAAKLIEHYLKIKPDKRVAFLVPTRPLVEQQSEYCKEHCRLPCGTQPPVVQTLVGQDQTGWSQSEWNERKQKSHIFLGTPAVFLDAFVKTKFLDVENFSLIIFDECHNARGNSPMAQIMRDSVAPFCKSCIDGKEPRVLGLTASFINGNMKNIVKSRRSLESLMMSNIFCPKVPTRTSDENFRHVPWSKHVLEDKVKGLVEMHVQETVKFARVKDVNKIVNKCTHVLEQLGTKAVRYYIDKVIVAQIKSKARHLLDQSEEGAMRLSTQIMNDLPTLEVALECLGQTLDADPTFQQAPSTTHKIDELIRLLTKEFSTNGPNHRGLVFVQQIALVSPLAKELNDALAPLGIKCGDVAGTGSQSELERQKHLDMFRQGDLRLLVATAALEEGIDVSECAFVVRFTRVTTTKAHIQGVGRARQQNSVIYYFDNDPVLERRKEASLVEAASNMSLNLSRQELQKAVSTNAHPYHSRHPYPTRACESEAALSDEGEVSFYNCKQIFNDYVSIALGRSVSTETVLYRYEEHDASLGSPHRLKAIRYPVPTGWIELTYNQHYRPWWGPDPPETIFVNDRLKHKSASEKEEMAFVYFVCVMMRTMGHLDKHNHPSALVRTDAKRNCPVDSDWASVAGFAIKNSVFQSY